MTDKKPFPLTPKTKECLAFAKLEAGRLRHREVRVGHVLLGMLRYGDCFAVEAMREQGVALEALGGAAEEALGPAEELPDHLDIPFGLDALRFLADVNRLRLGLGHDWVGTDHFLMAMSFPGLGGLSELLGAHGVRHEAVVTRFLSQFESGRDRLRLEAEVIDSLARRGLLTDDLRERLVTRDPGTSIRELFVEAGDLDETEYFEILERELGFPRLQAEETGPTADVVRRVDGDLVRTLHLIPLRLDKGTLYVATYDPLLEGQERLERVLKVRVIQLLAPRTWVDQKLAELYP